MSSAGNLGFLRAAIFAQLDRRPQTLSLPLDHPERPWLEWLGVPLSTGEVPEELGFDKSLAQANMGFDKSLAQANKGFGRSLAQVQEARTFKEEGILPEVVYSCLVQTWWHPGQEKLVARTRSEILACYDASQLDLPGWEFDLHEVQRVNAYRLQELTPAELLEASRPFWGGDCQEVESMEAWILLNLENFQRVQDVAKCLDIFWNSGFDSLCNEGGGPFRLPAGVDWEQALQILGPHRVERLRSAEPG